jgi:hypothetical protein
MRGASPRKHLSKADRNMSIVASAAMGETYASIARRLGLSRQRVHQIAIKYGVVVMRAAAMRRVVA